MKRQIVTLFGWFWATCCVSLTAIAQGNVDVRISRENDEGEMEVFERTYSDEDEMKEDKELKEFIGEDDKFDFYFDDDEDVQLRIHKLDNGRSFSFGFGDGDDKSMEFLLDDLSSIDFQNLDDLDELLEKLEELGLEDMSGKSNKYFYKHFDGEESRAHIRDLSEETSAKRRGKKTLLALDEFKVSLNFPGDELRLRFRLPETGELTIQILNEEGKELQKRYYESFSGVFSESFDLANYKSGQYFLDITLNNKQLSKRILID